LWGSYIFFSPGQIPGGLAPVSRPTRGSPIPDSPELGQRLPTAAETAHLPATRSTTAEITLNGCTCQGNMQRIAAGLEVELEVATRWAFSPRREGELQAGKTDDGLGIDVPLLVVFHLRANGRPFAQHLSLCRCARAGNDGKRPSPE
jgi:hypothetical protein